MKPEEVCKAIFADECTNVEPGKCSDRLAQFWHEFQEKRPEQNCLRVSTMNLVIVCSSAREVEGLRDDLEQISGSFPARVVVAVLDEEAQETSGWFAARSLPERDHHLGWELIGLHVQQGERLPSLVIPLLRDGLPVFLWWRGLPPFEASWFEHLVETSRRVILDSRSFANDDRMGSYLEPLAALAFDRYHQEQSFSDLSWGRIRQWGQLVSGLFDRPDNLLRISHIRSLEIAYFDEAEDGCGPPPMPMFMAAWLCSRMKWIPTEPLKAVDGGFSTRAGQVEVRFVVVPTDEKRMNHRLAHVHFLGEGFEPFGVDRDEADPERIGLSGVFSREELTHRLQLARRATLALMAWELETLGRDPVFDEAVRTALKLAGLPIPVREVKA